jgi:hypothetical protein
MDDAPPPLIKPSTGDAVERSLVDDVKHLITDGRTLLEAELAFQKSRAAVAGAGIKGVTGWGALALVLVFFALMAAVIGVLIGLGALIGIFAATGLMVLLLLVLAGLAGLAAFKRWSRMAAALEREDATP